MTRASEYSPLDPAIEERIAEAAAALDRGWALTPLSGKKPYRTGWQSEPAADRPTVLAWAATGNIGVRTGRASGVVVIDDDTLDGMSVKELDLPPTPTVRTGGGGEHYYFACPKEVIGCSTSKLAPKVDVKGDGGVIALAGSIHPKTGKQYEWMAGRTPADLPFAVLPASIVERLRKPKRERSASPRLQRASASQERRLKRYAEAALNGCVDTVSEAPEGARNDELNRQAFLVGRFVGAGVIDRAIAEQRLADASRSTGLAEEELRATLDSGLRAGIDDPHTIDELKERLRDAPADAADCEPAGDLPVDPQGRPTIVVEGGALHTIVSRAEEILLSSPGQPIYERGGMLVRTVRAVSLSVRDGIERRAGSLTFVTVDPVYLADRLTEVIAFIRWDARSKEYKPIDCPERVSKTLLARSGRWKARTIVGIIEAPTLQPDGSILDKPGYDEQTRLYFDPGGVTFPSIPAEPSRDDARSALAVLKFFLKDFPWVARSDCAAMLALILTALVRITLRAAPLFALRAPKMASGKSLLADCVALIATGRTAPAMTQGQNDEEDRKRMLAILMEGQPVACVDNVERPLSGPAICSVLTQEIWRDRVLGVSRTVSVPTAVTWIATGNNIVIIGDLVSRVVPCDIDPKVERPEERVFDIKPRQYVLEHRGELVAAALTILRAYHLAGRPDQGLSVFGRFEDWSDLVRSALVWAGEPDPCEGCKRLRRVDPVGRQIEAVLHEWHAVDGSHVVSAHQLISIASSTPHGRGTPLFDLLYEVAGGEDKDLIDPRRLGHWLTRHERRVEGGLHIERAGDRQGVALWRVVRRA